MIRICMAASPFRGMFSLYSLYALINTDGFDAALSEHVRPGAVRCPALFPTLADVLIKGANATPASKARREGQPPRRLQQLTGVHFSREKDAEKAAYQLMELAAMTVMPMYRLASLGTEHSGRSSAPALGTQFHEIALGLLARSGGSRLVEALWRLPLRLVLEGPQSLDQILQTHMLFIVEEDVQDIQQQACELATGVMPAVAPSAEPQAVESMLATLCKVLNACQDGSHAEGPPGLAQCALRGIEVLMTAQSMTGCPAGSESTIPLQPADLQPSSPERQDLQRYAAAWVLPTVVAAGTISCPWIAAIFLRLAHVVQGPSRVGATEPATTTMLDVLCMLANLLSAHPKGQRRQRGLAVAQTGRLRAVSQAASEWWEQKAWPAAFGVLTRVVLPLVCASLGCDASVTSRLEAVSKCFEGVASAPLHAEAFKTAPGLSQESTAAARAAVVVVEALDAQCGPLDMVGLETALERARMAALGPGCHNPACQNPAGACEADMRTCICSACHKARYCGGACQKAAWKVHKRVCKER
ncbi:hypothetical protein WJX72_010825 [[Myrmecia] bisecta]|uniref:MYND-type domain-containing protein n=1 Tax=[Myrmecia] bisecta TaxID=41462 RepID=A0AAW1PAU2_9CHLO